MLVNGAHDNQQFLEDLYDLFAHMFRGQVVYSLTTNDMILKDMGKSVYS